MFTIDPGSGRTDGHRHRGLVRARRGDRQRRGLAGPLRRRQGHAEDPDVPARGQGARRSSRCPRAGCAAARPPPRRAPARRSTTRRSPGSPTSRSPSSGITARRRTRSGPSTPTVPCGCCSRGPITAVGSPPGGAADDTAALGSPLVRGIGAAPGLASGAVRVVATLDDARALRAGEVLVTRMTAPDWVPLMRRAAAIVTDSGGMTCHAAIVSRELGVPCIVGTAEATTKLRDGEPVTVDATRGVVRAGLETPPAADATPTVAAERIEPTGTKLLVNLSEPSQVGARRRPRRRRRRPAARRDDDRRGARGTTPAPAASRWARAGVRPADGRRPARVRRRIRTAARSPTGRSTSARTSSGVWRAASSSSRWRPTR